MLLPAPQPLRPAVLAAVLVCLSACRLEASAGHPARETPSYRIFSKTLALEGGALDRISQRREALLERITPFLTRPVAPGTGSTLPGNELHAAASAGALPRIDYYVYASFEAKGLATGNTQLSHAVPDPPAVHVVVNDWIHGDDAKADATLLVRHHMGTPATHLLELGLAVYFSEGWREKGYEYWASRLFLSDNVVPLAELTNNATLGKLSYLVTEPLAGSFVAYVLDRYGRAPLFEHYASWQPEANEVARMEREWHGYLAKRSKQYEKRIEADRASFPRTDGFHKGFCHAHEGYQIFNGYLSRKSDEALSKLAGMGTSAVSITPFSYMRDPRKPVVLRFSHGAGSENDECVIHSAHTAETLGMSVMLKPHIWLGNSWPGEIEMQSPADWDAFFTYYYQWIVHYAMLAEIYRIDILCIGVEMAKTTVGHDADWQAIIGKLRGLYSGAMTYAANWGEEFEQLSFWEDLDYIGINCYYPLSALDEPSIDDLREGASRVIGRVEKVHERYNTPVLFTEIGFTSTDAPWKQPHEAAWRRAANVEHQALCYDAVFEALYGKDWCAGIYWWKWPTFLEFGGQGNPGFTPNNKPAEQVVRKWYQRHW